jgi:hypothetical protein
MAKLFNFRSLDYPRSIKNLLPSREMPVAVRVAGRVSGGALGRTILRIKVY